MLLTSTSEGVFLKQNDAVLKISDTYVSLVDSKQANVFSNLSSSSSTKEIEGILGIISLKVGKYLITINHSQSFGSILGNEVLKVADTSIIPLSSYSSYDSDEHIYLKLLRFQLDSSNLFFSHSYDLTNSIQRNFEFAAASKKKAFIPNTNTIDLRFFWNQYLVEDIINAAVASKNPDYQLFITPVISGYAKILEENINNSKISLGLITRRSKYRAGTRYFRRGIDSKGHVANYNETEQLVIYGNTVQSYLQTRGSVPAFWTEINNLQYRPKLAISASSPSVEAAGIHFDEQISKYGTNFLVNLVNQKGHELPVKNAYEDVVQKLNNDKLKYVYFDFHHECRKMQWHRVYLLIDTLEKLGLDRRDHFFGVVEDNREFNIIRRQQHVVRTNCMDCLDRTNVVQSTLGRYFLQSQLEQLNLVKEEETWDQNVKLNFEFQNFWADNADAVSAVYSGTGALKTDFTRTGTRTRKGAFFDFTNSVQRYIKNNYKDGARQDSFDLILGEYIPGQGQGEKSASATASPFLDNRPYQFRYIAKLFLFFLALLVAVYLKWIFCGLHTKQHVLVAICVVGLFVSGTYMFSNGIQVVNWPQLKQLEYLKKEPVYQGKRFVGYKYVINPEY